MPNVARIAYRVVIVRQRWRPPLFHHRTVTKNLVRDSRTAMTAWQIVESRISFRGEA